MQTHEKLLSRRRFLELLGTGAVAGSTLSILSACSMSTTAQSAASGGDERTNELNLYNWSDYVAEDTIPRFEEQTGVRVRQDFFASNDELLAKLQAGGTGYDIIVPTDFMVSIMVKSDLLEELDRSQIPNFENVGKDYKGLPFDPENRYSVPYQWGTVGILYDTEVVDEEVTSWDAMWDPRYEGKIVMYDEVRDTMAAALKRLGYSLNTKDPSELEDAKRTLIEQKPLLRGYFASTETRELVLSGDVALGHVDVGDAFLAIAENDRLRYVIPEEGTNLWMDNMAIPKGAPHPDAAHEFMNYILEPEVGAELSNYTLYGTPNEAAMPLLDKEVRDNPGIYPPQEVLDRLEVSEDLGETTREYQRIFTEVKSS